jgi:hypothetical protein
MEVFMKIKRNVPLILAALALIVLSASCATIGQYMPMAQGETSIGSVQADFEARDNWFSNKAINTLSYIKLMEAARREYTGDIEIRNIAWVSGKGTGPGTSVIAASGKVVRFE